MEKLSKERLEEMQKLMDDAEENGLTVFDEEEDIDWGKVDPEPKWHLKFKNKKLYKFYRHPDGNVYEREIRKL